LKIGLSTFFAFAGATVKSLFQWIAALVAGKTKRQKKAKDSEGKVINLCR
jgi:hypothetical protein